MISGEKWPILPLSIYHVSSWQNVSKETLGQIMRYMVKKHGTKLGPNSPLAWKEFLGENWLTFSLSTYSAPLCYNV